MDFNIESRFTQKFIAEKRLPQKTQISQKFIAEKKLPQNSQKFIAEKKLPQRTLRGCTCLRSALPLARARSAPTQQNLHSPTEFRTHSCCDILPQISQIYTELLLRKLPQISQNTQNFLAEIFSHRFHTQKLWCFQGGALVSSAPTQQNLHSPTEFRTHSCWDILPQISL